MQTRHLLFVALSAAMLATTGCVDDKYDLSDVDTTVQLQVKNLTLPINFEPIQLKSILKPSDDSCIKETEDGYAVVEQGSIKSDPISIAKQHITAPEVRPTVEDIYKIDGSEAGGIIETTVAYSIVDIMGDFEYNKDDIPTEILALNSVGVEWTLSIRVSVTDETASMRHLDFENVIINLPKGLTTSDSRYDPVTGDLDLGNVTLPAGSTSYRLDVPVTAVDLTCWNDGDFTFTPSANGGNGRIHLGGHVGVKSGQAILTMAVDISHPSSVVFYMQPELSDITINSFTGKIRYTLSNFNIPAVDISDLPDLLSDSQTTIVLSNPQLYLSVNNPVAGYGLDATTGLRLTPMRKGKPGKVCNLNPGQAINIGHNKGVAGPYTYCISPSRPEKYYTGYENAIPVGCSDFSNILAGEGVPTSIAVDLPGAQIVPGDVTDFKLGVTIGAIEGEYTVYCPLSMGQGSKVVYSDTIAGWNDDTVNRIVINDMQVTTTVVNTLPFDIELSGYPLSLKAEGATPTQSVDPTTLKGVSIKPFTVTAGSTVTVTTSTDGIVEHLDGIHFVARAAVDQADAPVISPDNTITLTDLRVTVSGSYTDKL